MSKILKNSTASPITITDVGGVVIPASPGTYTIPPMDWWLWAASSDILTYLNDGPTPSIIVNDGFNDLNPNDGAAYLQHYFRFPPVTTPTVKRLTTSATPNTETSYVFPANTRRFKILPTGAHVIRFSYAAGETADGLDYFERYPFAEYAEDNIEKASLTVYIRCKLAASQEVQIVSWV